jgi:hypothetical protein
MKKTGIVATILLLMSTLFMPCSGASAATDGYYNLTEMGFTWDGTDANRLKAPIPAPAGSSYQYEYDYTYGDESSLTYTLPWPFSFYGQSYNQINIDTNGNIWFGAAGSAHSFTLNDTKTSPTATSRGPVIAAWNNDLSSYYYGGVFVQHKTDAPQGDRVVIEWQTETYTEEGYFQPNNFEVVLSRGGTIRFDYKSFKTGITNGKDFGSGISKADNSHYLSITSTYNRNVFTTDGLSYVFYPRQQISVAPQSASMGSTFVNVATASQLFTVTSIDGGELVVDPVTLTGADSSQFIKTNDLCTGARLLPSGTCSVQVQFKPTAAGSKTALLSLFSNDPATPVFDISLNGIGILPTLTVVKTGAGLGLVSSSSGINCGGNCSASYMTNSAVTLTAVPDAGSDFAGWIGDCSFDCGIRCCTTTMDGDKTVTASFTDTLADAAAIGSSSLTYYMTIQSALAAAASGDTVKSRALSLTENLQLNRPIPLTLTGGYDNSYKTNTNRTTVHGRVTISNGGRLVVDKLTIQIP